MKWNDFKNTIAAKIMLGFLVIILLVLVIQTLVVTYGLREFYEARKIRSLQDQMVEIENIYLNSPSGTNVQDQLIDYALLIGGSIIIYNEDTQTGINVGQRFVEPQNFWSSFTQNEGDYYQDKVVTDTDTGLEWLICGKRMNSREWLIVEIPIASIEEAVVMLRFFTLYILMAVLFVAPILSLWISNKISRPIVQLNRIAKEMQNLNFNVRYEGKEQDEIGSLGRTFNMMNERLGTTITLLKQELAKEKQLKDLRKQFTAQVSHELKTPISIIKGYVEALGDDIPDTEEEKEYYLNVIQEEVDKMDKLIMSLLELSKLQTGNYPIEKTEFEYASLVRDILVKYDKMFREKNLTVEFYNSVDGVYVEADPLRIEQIITNLLNNAMNHAMNGKLLRIVLKVKGQQLVTAIYNDGNQIPDEDLPHLFESFYKRKSSGGSGLGLAIVQGLLELHNSKAVIRNVDQGVEVEFSLNVIRRKDDTHKETYGEYDGEDVIEVDAHNVEES